MTTRSPSNDDSDPTDPIAAAWANQDDSDSVPFLLSDPSALTDSVAKAHAKDQRRLLWLNVREVIPSVLISAVFASSAPGSVRPPATFAAAALVLAVGCFLAISSFRHYRADARWGTSVRDQLARRLAQLNHAAWLMRNVGWWYFLPLAVAILLFQVGHGAEILKLPSDLIFIGVIAAFCVVMYWVNRRVGRKYEVKVQKLEALLVEFDRTF